MGRNRGTRDLVWRGQNLHLGQGRKLLSIIPDEKYSGMWRVCYPDGHLTDMVNRTRAKDAAQLIALAILKGEETPSDQALAA
jgi:hypothetical protein